MQIFVCVKELLCPAMGSEAPKPKLSLSARNGTTKMLQQAARIMKLTTLLILGACLHVHAVGFGQKISLSESNVPIQKVFQKIEEQTNLKFLYADHIIKEAKFVTVNVKDESIAVVLELIFKNQTIGYDISNNTVIVKPKRVITPNHAHQNSLAVDIRGLITDERGRRASGVNIVVKGTSKGTTTNSEGEFLLEKVDPNAILLISLVGYETQEVLVKNRNYISIQLVIAIGNLDAVQVIAYGTTTKRFNTGNVSTISSSEIEKQPVSNPLLAMQGRVPGVFIEQANGLPGGGVSVRVQGKNSLSNGSDPLFVIDGVPYVSQMLNGIWDIQGRSSGTGTGNPLNYINPDDIERIDVLKDADATSIYGSRAAAGAILITTKKGKAGKTKVGANFQSGWGKVGNFIDLLNTPKYLEMRREAKNNDAAVVTQSDFDLNGTWDTAKYTDWQKELIGGTASYSDGQLTMSGGSENTTFLVGTGYHKETTVFPGDLSDRNSSFQFKLNHTNANRRFQVQVGANYLIDRNRLVTTDLTNFAIQLAPNAPDIYNSDGTLNWAQNAAGTSTWSNPVAYLEGKYNLKVYNLIGNANLSYELLKGFFIKSSFGYTNMQRDENYFIPRTRFAPESRASATRFATFGNDDIQSWIVEPQLTFKRDIFKGNLEVLFGGTFLKSQSEQRQVNGTGFSSDLLMEDIRSATTLTAKASLANTYKYNALFGRINYNWNGTYIVNLTARRDGSSRFGEKNLFNNFGSIAGAWIFTNETLFKKSIKFVSFGKLRGSYGTTGNDQIGDYRFMNLYSTVSRTVPYQSVTGLTTSGFSNPYLQWEETRKLQLGLDLGFFSEKVMLNLNYYRNRSSNQLQGYSLPIITGNTSVVSNYPATIENSGWELSVNSTNIERANFSWNTSINFTLPKNKLIKYKDIEQTSAASSLIVGEPFTITKLYHSIGVNPASGEYIFTNIKGDTTNNPEFPLDATVLINTVPKFYGGILNSISWKRFTLDVFLQFVKQVASGYKLGNQPGRFFSTNDGFVQANQPESVFGRWQKNGDITNIQRFSSNYPAPIRNPYSNATQSDLNYEDASYIRLKNVSISWRMPDLWIKKLGLTNARLFAQGQNIFTITNYSGLDPESRSTSSLPPLRIFTIGAQLLF